MGLDFDAVEYCKNIKQRQPQPPYACPVEKCDRSYKTIVGLQYHLVNYDHDNPQPLTPIITPHRKKARSRGAHHAKPKTPKGGDSEFGGNGANGKQQVLNPESLVTYNNDDATVQFNIDGKSVRIGIDDPLPFIDDNEFSELIRRGLILNPDAPPLEENASWARCEVPQANFCEITNYNVPDAPPRPLAYYRFIEKSAEELDGEIEYDVDEEDTAWLDWMNEQREQNGLNLVNIDTMELLMDRLEKESFFQAAANGTSTAAEVDDDAVCCICMDGECQNTNVILFCDMCNLAVHQDCYGVPYIPEGQWLCRRCLQSPSTPVSCVLCPNAGGAFKQTDRGQWAHVVCALWIPEVRFANTVFLEPIDSIETIPAARWRLTCYVCKEKGLGACIQCHRNSCYAAFHVTCAQQAGLYMTMDTVHDGHNDSSMHVQKFAYCHAHTPPDAKLKTNQQEVEDTRHKMKEARKALAKKRSSAPVVLIPTIPADRVQEIATMVHMQKKSQFLDRLIAYWTLKRQFRNGVPLLRRLQSQGNHHGVIHRNGIEGAPDAAELYKQLKYWQCLRQDLERARLLCELVRKREKLKAQYVKICEQVIKLKLNPLDSVLTKLLDALEGRDTTDIFSEPVDTNEVPDYCDIVKHPMDLGTMREKLKAGEYSTLELLEADFDLMIQNCLAYNNKDTVFYRAGIRMRDQAAPLFVQVRKELQREGLLKVNQMQQKDHVEGEVEEELKQLLAAPASEEIVQKLLILADKSQVLKDPVYRTKKIKQIRMEITRMRKQLQKDRLTARNTSVRISHSLSDDEHEIALAYNKRAKYQVQEAPVPAATINTLLDATTSTITKKQPMRRRLTICGMPSEFNNSNVDRLDFSVAELATRTTEETRTPPCSPLKSLNNSASPVGVNRRTAVLFTRKAQNALKRPSDGVGGSLLSTPVKEELQQLSSSSHIIASTVPNVDASALSNVLSTISNINYNNNNNNNNSNNNNNTKSSSSTLNNSNSLLATHSKLTASSSGLSNKLSHNLIHINNTGSSSSNNTMAMGESLSLPKSPKRQGRHKRVTEMRHSSSVSPKKSPSTPMAGSSNPELNYNRIPDSFRVYRANNERDVSDSDADMSDISGSPCSSCSGFSMSGSGSEYDSSEIDDDEDDEHNDNENNKNHHDMNDIDDDDDDDNMAQRGSDDPELEERENNNNNVEMRDSTNADNGERHMSCSEAEESSDGGDSSGSDGSSSDDDEILANRAKKRLNGNDGAHKLANRSPTPSQKQHDWIRATKKHKGPRTSASSRASTPPLLTQSERHKKNSKKERSCSNGREKSDNNLNHHKHQRCSSHHKSSKHNNHVAHHSSSSSSSHNNSSEEKSGSQLLKPPLEPLQLVWAKCRGYPWYPALILDPKTPKGFVYNGVPLPAPPPDVLALRKNYTDDHLFLVLFFDAKRTWQWLPANKLEILGIDKELDQQKLVESRKPTERKAVKKAYQDALHYQSQVSDLEGQGPDPIM